MIRWHIPKGTDLGTVSAARVREVQDWLNNYPRKILGWRTPAELFQEFLASVV